MTRLDRRQKRWTADNPGIFSSLMYPLAKALRAAQKGIKASGGAALMVPPRDDEWTNVALHFPIVVTSAPLYVLDATTEVIEPRPAGWATMSRQLKAAKITGDFSVDVVTDLALDDYLSERVVGFAEAVAGAVETNPESFKSNEAK